MLCTFEPERSQVEIENLVKGACNWNKKYSSKMNYISWCFSFHLHVKEWRWKWRTYAVERKMTFWMILYSIFGFFNYCWYSGSEVPIILEIISFTNLSEESVDSILDQCLWRSLFQKQLFRGVVKNSCI